MGAGSGVKTGSDKRDWTNAFLDVGIWLLFFALLVPAGFAGYEIGRSTAPTTPAAHVQKVAP
jgi:hypothetical protein